jgi:hypothetical protein
MRTVVLRNNEDDLSKEAPPVPTQQSYDTHYRRTADSQPQLTSLRNRESPKPKDAVCHLIIAQIAEMHSYDTSIKMELRC